MRADRTTPKPTIALRGGVRTTPAGTMGIVNQPTSIWHAAHPCGLAPHAQMFLSLLLVVVSAPSLAAQTSLDVGPLIGDYQPLGHFHGPPNYVTPLPLSPQQLAGAAWGAEARLWLGPRLGLEIDGMVTSRRVGGAVPPEGGFPMLRARVLAIAAEGVLSAAPAGAHYRLWVSAGPGMVRHDGAAYTTCGHMYPGCGPTTSLAGVTGVGTALPLVAGLSAVARATMDWYGYDVHMRDPSAIPPETESQRGVQADLLLRVGLGWAFP